MSFHRRGQNLLSLSYSADSDQLLQALNQANYTINEQTLIIEQYERRFAYPSTLRAQYLEKQLQAAYRRSYRYEQDIIFLSESHDRLRAEYLSILHTKNELQKSLRESTSNVYPESEDQAAYITDLNKQIRELSALKVELTNYLKQNSAEVKGLKRQLDEEKLMQRDQEEEIMRNKAEMSSISAYLAASEYEKTDSIAEIGILQQKIANLEAKVRAENEKNEGFQAQIAGLNYYIASYNQSIAQNDGKLKDEQHKLQDTENQVQLKTQEIYFLKGQYDVYYRQISALNERILKQNDSALAKRYVFYEVLEKIKALESRVSRLSAGVSNSKENFSQLLPQVKAFAANPQQAEGAVCLEQLQAESSKQSDYQHYEEHAFYEKQLDAQENYKDRASNYFSEDDFSENTSPKDYQQKPQEIVDSFLSSASLKHEYNACQGNISEEAVEDQETAAETQSQENVDSFDEDADQIAEVGGIKLNSPDRDYYPDAQDENQVQERISSQADNYEAESFEYSHSSTIEADKPLPEDQQNQNVAAELSTGYYDRLEGELIAEQRHDSAEVSDMQAKAEEHDNEDALEELYQREQTNYANETEKQISEAFSDEGYDAIYRLTEPEAPNEASQPFEEEQAFSEAGDTFSDESYQYQGDGEASYHKETDVEFSEEEDIGQGQEGMEVDKDIYSYYYDTEKPDQLAEEKVADEQADEIISIASEYGADDDAYNIINEYIATYRSESYQQVDVLEDGQYIESCNDEKSGEKDNFSGEFEQQDEHYEMLVQENEFEGSDAKETATEQQSFELEADVSVAMDQMAEDIQPSGHIESAEYAEEGEPSTEQLFEADQKPEAGVRQDSGNLPQAYEYVEITAEKTQESGYFSIEDESQTHADVSEGKEFTEEYIETEMQLRAKDSSDFEQRSHENLADDDNGPDVYLVSERHEGYELEKAELTDGDVSTAGDYNGPAVAEVDDDHSSQRSQEFEETDEVVGQRPAQFSGAVQEPDQAYDAYLASEEVNIQEEAQSGEKEAFPEAQDDDLELKGNASGSPEVIEQAHEPEMPEQEDSLTTTTPNGAEVQ